MLGTSCCEIPLEHKTFFFFFYTLKPKGPRYTSRCDGNHPRVLGTSGRVERVDTRSATGSPLVTTETLPPGWDRDCKSLVSGTLGHAGGTQPQGGGRVESESDVSWYVPKPEEKTLGDLGSRHPKRRGGPRLGSGQWVWGRESEKDLVDGTGCPSPDLGSTCRTWSHNGDVDDRPCTTALWEVLC